MTVGETLTEARRQAGLSIGELSERTRIRETVIRSIEQDDYEACGGDLYVRGYVRAIAVAVGIDAQPLIRDYDQGRADGRYEPANGSTGKRPVAPAPTAAPTAFDLPVVTDAPAGDSGPAALDATRFDLPVMSDDPAVTAFDLPVVPDVPPAAEPAEVVPPTAEFPAVVPPTTEFPAVVPPMAEFPAALPADTVPPAAPPSAEPLFGVLPFAAQAGPEQPGLTHDGRVGGKRRGLFAVAALVVLLGAGFLGVHLATGGTAAKNTAASTVPSQAAASAAARASASRASASAAARASASASGQARSQAAAEAAAQHVSPLPVASVAAYGPDGLADGDNPGNAQYAIAGDASLPWTSQWYVTPEFGMLKHGTGLLLNLGGTVTVSTVRLNLSQYQGADLQIRVGDDSAPQDLRVAAAANDAGGAVKLTLGHPAAARYLLIWFTQLPPDGAGHYQASVSRVVVSGRR